MTGPQHTTPAGRAILDELARRAAPTAPGVLATALGYNSSTALRHHMEPLLAAGRVVQTGKGSGIRFSLPPTPAAAPAATGRPPIVGAKPATEPAVEHVTVWDGRRGSPSLTGSVPGMGSSLSGAHAVVGSRQR